MKSLLRSFVINIAALYITISLVPGFTNSGGAKTLIISVMILAVINILVKPIISMLFLPINLLTLGSLRWLINVLLLFLLTLTVNQLQISPFSFPGFQYQGFIIPQAEVSQFWTLVISSATISLTNAFLLWLATGGK